MIHLDTTMLKGSTTTQIAEVLLPLALEAPYSYAVPEGLAVTEGSYVEVPLGPRTYIGVIWELRAAVPTNMKLRDLNYVFTMVPMPALHRQFIEWLANYYLMPLGMILRMCLRVPSAFAPPRELTAYRTTGAPPKRMTPQRARVLEIARTGLPLRAIELAQEAAVGTSVVKALAKEGALQEVPLPALRPFDQPKTRGSAKALSPDQLAAGAKLKETIGTATVTLLDGVTGSGKTEVYFEPMAEALRQNQQVLLLLPEIALTETFLRRVEERFECEPAAWHSGMRPRERERVWRGVAEGRAKIIVGARSALFLPWSNLGLIIVDEEHEGAYKQDEGITYHARDMAVVYGTLAKFPVILSSATPSLETIVNAEKGRYARVVLRDRHGRPELPEVNLINMREARIDAGHWLTHPLKADVGATLAAGDQALLFLNRRGYAPLTLCRACGHRVKCPHCAAWLVEHRFRRTLMCHHCGHQQPVPPQCPECQSEGKLVSVGPGVERLAEEAQAAFPEARIAVLSSDIARGDLLRETLRQVEEGEVNLVIGTQLVAKGHHFPHLTYVGVVDADLALELSDPRAGERTWALLAQVAGRSGRGEKPGRAVIQTYAPEHPLMRALASGDRESFFRVEKSIRENAGLPPYGRLAAIIVSGNDAAETERFAKGLARIEPQAEGVTVLGPAPAPIAVIKGRFRWRYLIKATRGVNIQNYLRQWLDEVKPKGSLSLQVDIDPYSFM